MRAEAKPRRRIWPWIIIAILAISAAIIAISVANGTWGTATPTTLPTAEPTATTLEPQGEPGGCLGGAERSASTVLAASEQAPETEAGAVDFAATFVRWIQRFPYPSANEASEVQEVALASTSFTDDLAGYMAAQPDLSGGIVPSGTDYWMSTVPGVWHVESASADTYSVSIGTGYVIDGELSPTLRSSITITLALEDDRWKVVDAEGTRTPADLYQIGTDFLGGC